MKQFALVCGKRGEDKTIRVKNTQSRQYKYTKVSIRVVINESNRINDIFHRISSGLILYK